jgi:hypothetical protein
MASPKSIHVLGKFNLGDQAKVKKFLGGFEQLNVVENYEEMHILLVADAQSKNGERKAETAAKANKIPIIREDWLRELVNQKTWVEPDPYYISDGQGQAVQSKPNPLKRKQNHQG